MIKKLRNPLYAPKSGASSQMGAKRKEKKRMLQITAYRTNYFVSMGLFLALGCF
jgi:hypothetical protein